jgi:hypothetical protein
MSDIDREPAPEIEYEYHDPEGGGTVFYDDGTSRSYNSYGQEISDYSGDSCGNDWSFKVARCIRHLKESVMYGIESFYEKIITKSKSLFHCKGKNLEDKVK